jgi:flavin reductase (DIM6/NTAB) family NADH-FMN oxidoreductase RutF
MYGVVPTVADMNVSITDYRAAISRFLTGVTLVTARYEGLAQGITASAVASVTLEPPTLLICLNRQSATCHAVSGAGRFCVHILADDQLELARHFASRIPDKFANLVELGLGSTHDSPLGNPIVDGALAYLECRVVTQTDVGTHRVFFGEVVSVDAREGSPLAYFRGQFASLGGGKASS